MQAPVVFSEEHFCTRVCPSSPLIPTLLPAGCGEHPASCHSWIQNIQAKGFLKALRDLDAPCTLILMDNTSELPAVLGKVSA